MGSNSTIKVKKKICASCGQEKYIFSHKRCKECAYKEDSAQSSFSAPIRPNKRPRKVTGELQLFKLLYEVRNHECVVCGNGITHFYPANFSHILSKGAYPAFRLNHENIQIMCFNTYGTGCHNKWDTWAKSDLRKDERWDKIFKLEEKLKQEYYDNDKK